MIQLCPLARLCNLLLLLWGIALAPAAAAPSQCFGSVSNGRIERAVQLPSGGENYSAYSSLGVIAGRTYVHSKVAEVIKKSYAELAKKQPEQQYVYAETGWSGGGRIRPHRTHQNGLSVDFMVPVRNREGVSVPLPGGMWNRYGYDLEFDLNGRLDDYRIDFDAIAEHLYQLHRSALAEGIDLALVIFDPPLLPKLYDTARGPYLRKHLNFLSRAAWVRHDEHYHVDFAVPCKPLKS